MCNTGSGSPFIIHHWNSSVPPARLSADFHWQLTPRQVSPRITWYMLCTHLNSPEFSLFHSVHQLPREPATMVIPGLTCRLTLATPDTGQTKPQVWAYYSLAFTSFWLLFQQKRSSLFSAIYDIQSMSVPCLLKGYRGAMKINQDMVPALKVQPSRNHWYRNT